MTKKLGILGIVLICLGVIIIFTVRSGVYSDIQVAVYYRLVGFGLAFIGCLLVSLGNRLFGGVFLLVNAIAVARPSSFLSDSQNTTYLIIGGAVGLVGVILIVTSPQMKKLLAR